MFFEETVVISALDMSLSRKAEALGEWCKEDSSENGHLSEDDLVGALLQQQQHSFMSLSPGMQYHFPGTGKYRDPSLLQREMEKDW